MKFEVDIKIDLNYTDKAFNSLNLPIEQVIKNITAFYQDKNYIKDGYGMLSEVNVKVTQK